MTSALPVTLGSPDDADPPLLSIVVPVYRTRSSYLAELLDSVRAQTDPDWELILVDDGSTMPEITGALTDASAADTRIKHEALDRNAGIVAASNRGLQVAQGQFIALLDHDDVLAPDAVEACRQLIRSDPEVDILYSDETIIGPAGEVLGQFRKPAFSPERLRGQMYTGHLGVYRRSLLRSLGGFREGFDGSQDYDLVLRATELTKAVRHIPRSLYRWRTLPTSVSHSAGNDHVFDAARRALAEHLERTGVKATVTQTDSTGRYRIRRDVPDELHVTVVVPTYRWRAFADGADRTAVPHMVSRLLGAAGSRSLDVVILDSGLPPAVRAQVGELLGDRGHLVPVTGDPWSIEALNRAVLTAAGELVLLMGDDVVPDGTPGPLGDAAGTSDGACGWLDVLVGLAVDPTAALVAPRLLGWDGRVASAGVALSGGRAHAIGAGCTVDDPGPFGSLQIDREVTAVAPDCVLFDRQLFESLGGFSSRYAAAAACADLALKAAFVGRRTVISSAVNARVGSNARLPSPVAVTDLTRRWGGELNFDAYWRDIA